MKLRKFSHTTSILFGASAITVTWVAGPGVAELAQHGQIGEVLAPQAAPASGGPVETFAPGDRFRDSLRSGAEGPEMVVIPAGRFRMGCVSNDSDCFDDEKPAHEVVIAAPFCAVGAGGDLRRL